MKKVMAVKLTVMAQETATTPYIRSVYSWDCPFDSTAPDRPPNEKEHSVLTTMASFLDADRLVMMKDVMFGSMSAGCHHACVVDGFEIEVDIKFTVPKPEGNTHA